MFRPFKNLLVQSVAHFIDKEAPSRGAAVAFYVVTSFVPILLIVIAIAGFAFGEDAARGAIVRELRGLLGKDGAELLQNAIRSASNIAHGTLGATIGIVTLILTSSGVFVELRDALNAIWGVKPRGETFSRFLRARVASLGLILALGFLLMISLVIDAVTKAMTARLNISIPIGAIVLEIINSAVSFSLIVALFAAIYKTLPAKRLSWRDVAIGAVTTGVLFELGKFVIGSYLGNTGITTSFGAAGALIALLFWIYYSAQIFLFGAALTRTYVEGVKGEHVADARGAEPIAQTPRDAHSGPTSV